MSEGANVEVESGAPAPMVGPLRGAPAYACAAGGLVAGAATTLYMLWGRWSGHPREFQTAAWLFGLAVALAVGLGSAGVVHLVRWDAAEQPPGSAPPSPMPLRRRQAHAWPIHHFWPIASGVALVLSVFCLGVFFMVGGALRDFAPEEVGAFRTGDGMTALFPQLTHAHARAAVVIRPDAGALARLTSDGGAEVTIESRPGHAEVRLESTGGTLWIRIPPDSPPELVAHDAKGNEVWRVDGSGARAAAAPPPAVEEGK